MLVYFPPHLMDDKKRSGNDCPGSFRDAPFGLLEQYANPLLNFIFLIPLIRNWGIKPAGRNPC